MPLRALVFLVCPSLETELPLRVLALVFDFYLLSTVLIPFFVEFDAKCFLEFAP